MKILVTGCGYIGSTVIGQLLSKGYEVIGLDNGFGRTLDSLIPFCACPNFEFIKGDILDGKLIGELKPKVDFIVQSAALAEEPICYKYPGLSWQVNAEAVRFIVGTHPRDIPILFTSTGSVFGKVEGNADENTKLNGLSVYAKSKIKAEEYIVDAENYIIYRFATAFGLATSSFRLNLLVNDLVYQAYKNKTITIFQADFLRTFCHVRDLADSIIFGIENWKKMNRNIFCVGNNECNLTKRQLAELISKKTGCSIFYGAEEYKDIDQRNYGVNIDKMNNMGWKAKIDMEEGIDELLKMCPLLKTNNQYLFI